MSFKLTSYPSAFSRPDYISGHSAWMKHIPFAFTVIEALRPKILVELGTHFGDSYCAFCQSADELKIDVRCFAVDTWEGDPHAGFYGEDVLDMLRNVHDRRYGNFSTLLKHTFDEAASYFAPGTIDLLHIDGLHTYDAVKHDFETWLPLLSERSVVLFHDTNVRENDFGVWKLWEELSSKYPSFSFYHGHGLGVLGVGNKLPAAAKALFQCSEEEANGIRNFFAQSGETIVLETEISNALKVQNSRVDELETRLTLRDQVVDELEAQLALRDQVKADVEDSKSLLSERLDEATLTIADLEQQKLAAASELLQLEIQLHETQQSLSNILNSKSWRLFKPARTLRTLITTNTNRIKRVNSARKAVGGWRSLARATYTVWRADGFKGVRAAARGSKSARLLSIATRTDNILDEIALRLKTQNPNPVASNQNQLGDIKISIVMPVYKVDIDVVKAAVDTVLGQTHQNWELCIADDCSLDPELSKVLTDYTQLDTRIKLLTLTTNQGISGASNAALSLATGNYIALMDNDDILTFDALEIVASTILSNPGVDILYSDECKVDETGKPVEIFAKPNWSPMLMLNCMYIGHLGVYRRTLIEQIGGFRSEFDFSQDYDLALRASESATQIVHIPEVLYGWRMIESSAAAGGKPYARTTNIAALQAAIERRGWRGQALALPTANKVAFDVSMHSGLVSIIVPSDNQKNIENTIKSIVKDTGYKNFEIIVVTNSTIVKAMQEQSCDIRVQFCPYDKPYNFSDKCNAGAATASGEFLIFFNDDVRVISTDWLDSILEYLALDGVGIVGPKLLYENNTIQHAGMVTGVRRLVGTAFHSLPADTTLHYNFAQSVREVSLICGACLAISKTTFDEVCGFDAENTPINHSDVDLCFKVRDLGLSCVYTPHATLLHIGHMSLAEVDKKKSFRPKRKDKADIFLLRRWSTYLSHDPYFTKPMRDLLYHDSPEPYQIFGDGSETDVSGGTDILLVSHDLTESGAPRVVLEMARSLKDAGNFVVVASPEDGPMRNELQKIGVLVIVDSLLLTAHSSVKDFARNFDLIIANTAVAWPIVQQLSPHVDVYWYIHETGLIAELATLHTKSFTEALSGAKMIIAGSRRAASALKDYRTDVVVLEYGLDSQIRDLDSLASTSCNPSRKLVISVFGSYEPRKGQDLFIAAVSDLPSDFKERCEFRLHGRVLDAAFFEGITKMASNENSITLNTHLTHIEYLRELANSDLIVVPSRDDTLPLVSLNALSAAKPLMCTLTTGTAEYLTHGATGYVISSNHPPVITQALLDALANSSRWHEIGLGGRQVFDTYFSRDRFSNALLMLLKAKTLPKESVSI